MEWDVLHGVWDGGGVALSTMQLALFLSSTSCAYYLGYQFVTRQVIEL